MVPPLVFTCLFQSHTRFQLWGIYFPMITCGHVIMCKNSLLLKLNVASKLASKHLWGYHLFCCWWYLPYSVAILPALPSALHAFVSPLLRWRPCTLQLSKEPDKAITGPFMHCKSLSLEAMVLQFSRGPDKAITGPFMHCKSLSLEAMVLQFSRGPDKAIKDPFMHCKSLSLEAMALQLSRGPDKAITDPLMHYKSFSLEAIALQLSRGPDKAIIDPFMHCKSLSLETMALQLTRGPDKAITDPFMNCNPILYMQAWSPSGNLLILTRLPRDTSAFLAPYEMCH